jgi:hypothetical protein
MKLSLILLLSLAVTLVPARGGDSTQEDNARRTQAVAEFTARMKAANYPALFDQAAAEFNVPSDILKGIAFAETRWEHLTWPPGETASPETGMPRPYGIMSLWDNQYFGHSLIDAAALIGKDPEVLKQDPLQNIRGAAALLRKIYDQNPRPADTQDAEIESWRYAVRKYCGIPEPDLNARHALDVYSFISKGYHEFGIEWPSRPVNLEPIRAETARIVAEEDAKRANAEPKQRGATNASTNLPGTGLVAHATAIVSNTNPRPMPQAERPANEIKFQKNWLKTALIGLLLLIVGIFAFLFFRRK